jgi:branched-chain amino acid transport system substrate-binding protein
MQPSLGGARVRRNVRIVRWAVAAAAVAAAASARAQSGEFVFGQAAPFSGAARELGLQMRVGIEAAFAAQNEAGGVHGRRLRLVSIDDGYEPTRTAVAMKELVEGKKVFGIIGNVGTPTAVVAVPYANEKHVLFFGAFTGASLLRNDPPDRYVFNYRASYAEETAAIVRYLVDVRRIPPDKIAVFAQEDSYGDAGFNGVAKAMRHYRRDPGKVLRVGYKRNSADVEEAVSKMKKAGAHARAVVMVATYKAAARFIERMRDTGHDLVFTNVSFVGSNALGEELAQLGARYAEGVIVTQVVPPPASRATAIMKYREQLARFAPGEKPDYISLEGWVAARLLVEGLLRAGKEVTPESLIDALEQVKQLDIGIGVPLTFGPSEHQASHKVWGSILDGKGQLKPLELE